MRDSRPTAIRISAPSTRRPSPSSAMTPAPPASILGLDAGVDLDAEVVAQRVRHFLAGERLLAGEEPPVALDQRHRGPEARPGLGELAADRPAAEHDHALAGPAWRWCPGGCSRARPCRARRSAASRRRCRWRRPPRSARSAPRRPRSSRRSPSNRASPRKRSIPRSSSQGSWPESSRSWITSSRRSSTACGVELAGRRSGHAGDPARLFEHVGGAQQRLRGHAGVVGAFAADQLRSTIATSRPPSARRPAQTSPAARPPPTHRVSSRTKSSRVVPSRRVRYARSVTTALGGTIPDTVQFQAHSTGATGFDVVDSCERLQVEVAGGLVKHRQKPIRADHEFALAA